MGNDVIVSVGEPWDFTSSDGDNKFLGKIIKRIKNNYEERYLIRVKNPFKLKNKLVNYVVAQTRNIQYPDKINIYYISDEIINLFDDLESIRDKLELIAIGSFIK